MPVRSLFKPYLDIEEAGEKTFLVRAGGSAVFSNWIPFKRQFEEIGLVRKNNVVVDLSDTKLVDHSVMEKLHEMQRDFEQEGLSLTIIGLDMHRALSEHEFATRKRSLISLRRVTIVADASLQERLIGEDHTVGRVRLHVDSMFRGGTPRPGRGRTTVRNSQIRLEIVAPRSVSDAILDYLRRDILKEHQVTACVETVDVVNPDHF